MPATRLGFLLLPQAGVVYAYQSFHQSVASTLMSGPELLALGLPLYTLLVVVLAVLTLGVNFVLAAALLNVATKLDSPRDAGRIRVDGQSTDDWTPGFDAMRALNSTPAPRHDFRRTASRPFEPTNR